MTICGLDIFILVVFLLIPAGIVHQIEPCMSYESSLWYLFATVSTIGFGDVVAGTEDHESCSYKLPSHSNSTQ